MHKSSRCYQLIQNNAQSVAEMGLHVFLCPFNWSTCWEMTKHVFSFIPSSSSFFFLKMFIQDKVTVFDFTGERAPYRMRTRTGSEHVSLAVCVWREVLFQLFSCINWCGRLAAQNNNQEIKVIQSGETAKTSAIMSGAKNRTRRMNAVVHDEKKLQKPALLVHGPKRWRDL